MMFFIHVFLNNRVLIFQVQSSCVFLDARRLVAHSRTCWTICCFLPFEFWTRFLTALCLPSNVRRWRIYAVTSVRFLSRKARSIPRVPRRRNTYLQRVASTCRACPITLVFDISGLALATTRFVTIAPRRNICRKASPATSSAVIPSKILVADLEGPRTLRHDIWQVGETPKNARATLTSNVSRDPRTSPRFRRRISMQACRMVRPTSEGMAGVASRCLCPARELQSRWLAITRSCVAAVMIFSCAQFRRTL